MLLSANAHHVDLGTGDVARKRCCKARAGVPAPHVNTTRLCALVPPFSPTPPPRPPIHPCTVFVMDEPTANVDLDTDVKVSGSGSRAGCRGREGEPFVTSLTKK